MALPRTESSGEPDFNRQQRVAAEITTTFASEYSAEGSLAQALSAESIAEYGLQKTGQKYLINPTL